jgi:hypothetical protein
MRSTLFHLPTVVELGGSTLPLFGWGLLPAVWLVVAGAGFIWAALRQGPRRAAAALRSCSWPRCSCGCCPPSTTAPACRFAAMG